jgi:hypothetical protein
MLGTYQQSQLRIEISASAKSLRASLLETAKLRQWLFPQRLEANLPNLLTPDLAFTSWLGGVAIDHHVDVAEDNCLRLLLAKGIDGFHEWVWGEGWVQSRLEGISLLPLNLGHTVSLMQLRQFVQHCVRDET